MLFYYTKIVFNHPYSILYALTASLANYVSATLWHPFFLCSFILLLMMFLVFFPISWKFVKMDKFQIFFMLCSTDSLQLLMMYCGTRNTTKQFKMTLLKNSLKFYKIHWILTKIQKFPSPDGAPGTVVSGIGDPRTSGDRGSSGDRGTDWTP